MDEKNTELDMISEERENAAEETSLIDTDETKAVQTSEEVCLDEECEEDEKGEDAASVPEETSDGEKKSKSGKWKILLIIPEIIIIFAVVFMQWICLESTVTPMNDINARRFVWTVMSFCVILAINALLTVATGRTAMTLIITSSFFSVLSVANFYVNTLHGSPLRISEIKSFATAMDVIGGYQITVPPKVLKLVAVFVLELLIVFLTKKHILNRHKGNKVRIVALVVLLLSGGYFYYKRSKGFKANLSWSWEFASTHFGYSTCLVEDTIQFITKFEKPEGYSEEKVDEIAKDMKATPSNGEYSDIILILNESFYDPNVSKNLEITTDNPYISYFYSVEGVQRGYTVVPTTGTNATEFVFLSGNSSSIVNPSAPFNFIPMGTQNTVVTYLKSLGYETWGMHNAGSTNYSRNIAYYNMSFDHVLFQEDFTIWGSYASRMRTDSADYQQLIKCYESGGDGPRFIYLLTFQNHGGYEQNDDSLDLVHVNADFGQYTDDANEFLTSISMSDSALKELFDYFSTVDRHVTIAMIGDHPPVFASSIMESNGNADLMYNNMTPYIVWSNYKTLSTEYEYISASDIVPMTLKAGDVPLSPYYTYILDMQKKIPARNGIYALDPECRLLTIAEDEEANKLWNDYLFLEYNNLTASSGRRQELFDPPTK